MSPTSRSTLSREYGLGGLIQWIWCSSLKPTTATGLTRITVAATAAAQRSTKPRSTRYPRTRSRVKDGPVILYRLTSSVTRAGTTDARN